MDSVSISGSGGEPRSERGDLDELVLDPVLEGDADQDTGSRSCVSFDSAVVDLLQSLVLGDGTAELETARAGHGPQDSKAGVSRGFGPLKTDRYSGRRGGIIDSRDASRGLEEEVCGGAQIDAGVRDNRVTSCV
jgi:hypothetical protein